MTINIFEAIFRSDKLKWDAYWQLFCWLCDPSEGHGLDSSVIDALTTYCFGEKWRSVQSKLEFKLESTEYQNGKWPDLAMGTPDLVNPSHLIIMDDVDRSTAGTSRKLENLSIYQNIASENFPDAKIRLLVLTNAWDESGLPPVLNRLGDSVAIGSNASGWQALPLRLTADWVSDALQHSTEANLEVLSEYCMWARTIGQIGG